MSTRDTLKIGDEVGKYRLERILGEGGAGKVFAARHKSTGRLFALKVLLGERRGDEKTLKRLEQEAKAGAIDHRNIVQVLDVEIDNETPYIVMELIDGPSLRVHVDDPAHRLAVHEIARVGRDVASALVAAHAQSIIHRDIKPSNVLLDPRDGRYKLTDFGIARNIDPQDSQLTADGQLLGTIVYMAPEQLHGEATAKSDLYGLGATLYELFTGRVDVGINPRLDVVRSDVPAQLAGLVERMMARRPEDRPADAAEIVKALEPYAVEPKPAPANGAKMPFVQGEGVAMSSNVKRAIGAALAAGVAAVALLFLWPSSPPPVEPPRATIPPTTADAPPPTPTAPPSTVPTTTAEAPTAPVAPPEPVTPPAPVVAEPVAPPVVTTPPAPPAAPIVAQPTAEPPVEQADLDTALASVPCLDGATASPAAAGIVTLAGVAGSAELAAEAKSRLAAVPGVKAVEGELRVVAAVGCAGVARLQRLGEATGTAAPSLALNHPDAIYRVDDFLVIKLTMPPGLGGYIYLDLVSEAGEVAHLLPEELNPQNKLAAGKTVQVGAEEAEVKAKGGRAWTISPPLGPAWLVATATEKPLYEGLRPLVEPMADYEPLLTKALQDGVTYGKRSVAVQRIEQIAK